MARLYKFSSQSLRILALLFFIITLLYSLQSAVNTPEYSPFMLLGLIPGIIGVLIIAWWMNRYLTKRQTIIFLSLLAFSLRLIWVLMIHTNVVQDFEKMYLGAVDAAHGDFQFADKPYFTTWVYQLGFTMYQAGVLKIFGEGTFALKFLNIIYCTGITLFTYRIAARLFNEYCGRIAGLIFAVYVPNILMCSVLTNEHFSTFLFYAGFYLLIKKGISHVYAWIFVGILLSLGDIMRPLGSVILLALAIFLCIVYIIGNENVKKAMVFKKLIGIIGVFYIVHYVCSYSLIAAGITQYPLSNRDPYWKFVLGFNHTTTGQFSVPDYKLVNQYEVGEERFDIEKNLIKERTADKKQLLVLFKDKFKVMWGSYDAAPYWSLEGYEKPRLQKLLWIAEKLMYITISIFAIISLASMIKGNTKKEHLFFLLLILGYAAVHILIEIQTRYRSFIIPSFVIIQSYGMYVVTQYVTTYIPFFRVNKREQT
ncbi:ArnT family glycosyltransferase [Bacillus sp. S14(2024)]|uniref:ArnT family glycosyltransferase n=1 Tax=Bacillus sp. S14(2024) TaxID=3162884 RepID=UPI003D23ABEA